MKRRRISGARQVHWRILPLVYEVLENRAFENNTSVSTEANLALASSLKEDIAFLVHCQEKAARKTS